MGGSYKAPNIGPLTPTIHGIRVASGFEFSVCLSVLRSLSVCSLFVLIKFSNLFIHTLGGGLTAGGGRRVLTA